MSKKLIAFFSILGLSFSISLVPAYSAIKAGASCKTLGITSVASGKTFTCIKSGKKLVWNKGIKVTAPKPSTTPTPILQPPVITISELNLSQVNANIYIPKYDGIDSDVIAEANKEIIAIQLSFEAIGKPIIGSLEQCDYKTMGSQRHILTTPTNINCTWDKGNEFKVGYIIRSPKGWGARSPYVLVYTGNR